MAREGYDAILLDVDNLRIDALTERPSLFERGPGANAGTDARRGLAIWYPWADHDFTARLEKTGFSVKAVAVGAKHDGQGFRHLIWFARKPAIAAGQSRQGGV